MRICFIIEAWKPFYTGGQVHAEELCKRLVNDYDCSIDVYTRRLKVKGKKYTKKESHFNGKLKIIRLGITSNYNNKIGKISWILSVFFRNLLKKYDIIHGQANLGGIPTKMLGIFKKSTTVFTVHGSGLNVWDELEKGISVKINRSVEKFLQTGIKYDKEISVDSSFLKFKNKNKPIVIPNGVDITKYDKINVEKNNKFKIIFVGRLHPQKGLKYLIDAIDLIKNKLNNDVVLHIIGSGELEQELKQKVSELGLNNIIKFRGKIFGDDLIKEYKSSHLFVLPSVFEGQPLTLLEAWAAKLPVLVTDVGGNKDFVDNGKNGWIIKSEDSKILATTLLKITGMNEKQLKKIGTEGYNKVRKEYTWDKMVRRTFDIYRQVAKKELM